MSTCFHCGLPVPAGATFALRFKEEQRNFCCLGCEAVSHAITGLGLDDYYRLRTAPGIRPESEPAADLAAFDRLEEQVRFVTVGSDGLAEAQLLVEGLQCAACAWLIEEAVGRIAGVASLEVSFTTRRAWLRWDREAQPLSRVLQAIRELGYRPWPYDEGRLEVLARDERRGLFRRLCIAGLGMMQVMMYAVPGYIAAEGEVGADAESLMRWAGLALTAPVIGYSAWPFLAGAGRDLRRGRFGMDLPIALGLAAAFIASAIATFRGSGPVYFDSVTMFVFLVTGSRYLESLARDRAAQSLRHLARVVPSTPVREGEVVTVAAGASVPADGLLENGAATVSEAWLTGESRPLTRIRGDWLLAGSVNLGSAFAFRVARVGSATALSGIQRMMERALAERPRWLLAAERAASWFVALVLAAALLAGLAWWRVDADRAIWIAISVLIVTCPCAFALATPAALTVAMGRLARGNVAVTHARALEALATAQDVVFDKTGTLTLGRPVLRGVRTFGEHREDEARRLAASLAGASRHPLDRALAAAAEEAPPCEFHESVAGQGLQARIAGRLLRLGRGEWAAELAGSAPPVGHTGHDTKVWLAAEGEWIAAFALGDALRPEAAEAVECLRRLGLAVHLLSGDEPAAVQPIADALRIERVIASALPERKQRYVRNLQLQGRKVVMVGDGINDAPVLAQADVSIAMGGGADLAQLRADAVLLSDSLRDLVGAVKCARRTRNVIRQNIGWALAYNALAIPLAVAGFVTPLVASIGMSASSLLVVGNALRLRR